MKNPEKTENIGQTMKNDAARRKTREKKFRSREGSKKKERLFSSSKSWPQNILNFFQGKKKAETEMKKKR